MADQSPQKQIVDKLKDVESILVTVNTNPTVDELSAALGCTLLLNKMGKHATAVFSGDIPPAITFLDPEKTFENTVNSLRDFIIALDKEKADHLRYKVDGDMVKIFITPYRTTISQDDLDFSQGDYNVEMVIAIGVKDEADLDKALADHGKIMHDAAVASLSVGSESSDLGSINWHDDEASSYSEMLVSVAESLKGDKNLIDEQIATAFLTGIVAATERFSNQHTTSKVMTMAAQLMAAGANQQLIATQLEEADEIPQNTSKPSDSEPQNQEAPDTTERPKDTQAADGSMQISHEMSGDVDEVAAQTEKNSQDAAAKKAAEALEKETAERALADNLEASGAINDAPPALDSLKSELEAATAESNDAVAPAPAGPEMSLPTPGQQEQHEPMMGGTLNATTEEAAAAKLREEQSDRNKQLLSHDHGTLQYVGNAPASLPAINSFTDESAPAQPTSIMDGDEQGTARAASVVPPEPAPPSLEEQAAAEPGFEQNPMSFEPIPAPQSQLPPLPPQDTAEPTLADLDAENRLPHEEARAAINDAFNAAPSTEDQLATVQATPPTPPPPLPVIDNPSPELPPLPPMPDFSTLPPLPTDLPPEQPAVPPQDPNFIPPSASSEGLDAAFPLAPPVQSDPAQPQAPFDPGQFKIPGQN